MALCVITIYDNDDGSINVNLMAEPMLNIEDPKDNSPAQTLAGIAMHALMKETGTSWNEGEDRDKGKPDFEVSFGTDEDS